MSLQNDVHDEMEDLKGTIPSTFISILSNVIGGGILAISLALHYTSIVPGLCIFTVVTVISLLSMSMLIEMSEHTKCFSYMEICHFAFEKAMGNSVKDDQNTVLSIHSEAEKNQVTRGEKVIIALVELTILVYTFSCCVMYIIIIGDSMEPLSQHWLQMIGFCSSSHFWILVSIPILWALSSIKQITDLKVISVLSFLTILYLAVVACFKYYEVTVARHAWLADTMELASFKAEFFKAIPIFTVCYGMHYNIPPLYKELRGRSIQKMNRALYPSYLIITALYLLVGLFGYFHFGSAVTKHGGDLLAQYSESDLWINIGRLLMIVHFLFVFPLLSIGCRRSINLFIFKGEDGISLKTRLIEALVIVALATGMAILSRGISNVLALSGSLCGVHIITTIPALMYRKIFYRSISRWMSLVVVVLTATGIFFSMAGLTAQIYSMIQ
ncbi:amino acid permease-like protein [Perkinsela sp. CCAP 1560/4]|nr:amino acid permease-like protein [Perkinsela sp. CCAP 1560/4]|eukprot:KNH07860.1 amino acid permease-like protein [Perkinsela sp. CCAP 1560/4]